MALNVKVTSINVGVAGNTTISLPANFDPKAIVVWGVPMASATTVANYLFSYGYATYRGGTVSQRCHYIKGLDAAATADTSYGAASDAVLVHYTTAAGTAVRDVEVDLVSMQTGATSNVILNVVNAYASTANVFVLVLGGSDITDALVGDLSTGTASATFDETVVAGFGKPDLMFFGCTNDVGTGDFAGDACISYGFAKQGEAGRMQRFAQTDGNTASIVAAQQRADRCVGWLQNGAGTSIMLGRLETTVASWPTDGFRMLFDAAPSLNTFVSYLALRGTFQTATGQNSAPIVGTPPVVQDNAAGFAPKGGLLFNWSRIASTTVATADTTAADLVSMGIGATDGTTDEWAGWTEDDAAGTMVSKSAQWLGKVIVQYSSFPSLQGEADGLFSGNNFRVTWTTVPSGSGVAGSYQWLAIGDAPAGGTNWTQPVNDTVTMSDSTATESGKTAAPADTVTPADALQFDQAKVVADTVTMSDARAFDRAITVADSVTMSDSTVAGRDLALPVADTVTPADSVTTATGKGVSLADSVTMSDTAPTFDRGLAVPDSVTPTDALTFQRELVIPDTVSLTDLVAQGEEIHIGDTLSLSDFCDPVKTVGGGGLFQSVDDTVTVSDGQAFQRDVVWPIADTVTLADLVSTQRGIFQTVSDTVSPGDSIGLALGRQLALADTVTLADALLFLAVLQRVLADTVAVADNVVTLLEGMPSEGFAGPFDSDTERGRVSDSERSDDYTYALAGYGGARNEWRAYRSVQWGGATPELFAPDDLPGLAIWLDASQLGLTDGAAVTPWPNLGSGADAPIVGSPAPTCQISELNGLPVVRFIAGSGDVRMTSTGVDTDYTLVYVARMNGPTARRVVCAINPPANLLLGYWNGYQDVAYGFGGAGFFSPDVKTAWTASPKLYSADASGSTARLFSDGTLLSSNTAIATGWGGTFCLSGEQAGGFGETSDCDVAEVCLYDRKLADTDRQDVEDYMREKWLP